MNTPARLLFLLPLLGACTYLDTPHGRYLNLDLPVETRHTVHKTVHIHAPPGTTVIYGDSTPAVHPDTYRPGRGLIRSHADDHCLDSGQNAADRRLTTQPCHGRTNQQFVFDGSRIATASGLCLDADGTEAGTRPCNGGNRQIWFADGRQIRSGLNGYCLDSARGGGYVRLLPCDGSPGQQFYR